jgi:hypothetical protein
VPVELVVQRVPVAQVAPVVFLALHAQVSVAVPLVAHRVPVVLTAQAVAQQVAAVAALAAALRVPLVRAAPEARARLASRSVQSAKNLNSALMRLHLVAQSFLVVTATL